MASKVGPYRCTLRPELIIKAQTELNENPRTRPLFIEALREKVLANKALKSKTDDAFLLRFLRARKFNVDRAYEVLLNYYKVRAENRTIFNNFKPSTIKHVLEAGVTGVLPDRDQEGRRIILIRPGRWNPEEVSMRDLLRTDIMTFEKVIEEEETQICGIILLVELSEYGIVHARNFERGFAKVMSSSLQLRMHGSDFKDLHKNFLEPDILPGVAGGNQGPYSNQKWMETMLASEATFEEMEKYEIILTDSTISRDERYGSISTGTTGSYKTLRVD